MDGRTFTVFILITVSAAGVAQAQPAYWSQPAMRPQPQYYSNAGVATVPAYSPPVQQPQQFHVPRSAPAVPGNMQPTQQPLFVAYSPGNSTLPPPVPSGSSPHAADMSYQQAPQGYSAQSYPCTPPTQPAYDYSAAGMSYGADNCAGGYGYGQNSYCPPMNNYACPPTACWFGSVGALMLNREDENHRTWSYDSNDESFQLLDSQDSNFDWAGGFQASIGRFDCCSCTGCELVYWGIFPEDGYAYAFPSQVAGDLNGIFNFDQLDYNGQSANNFVDGAEIHRLRRETEIHNVEFNHIWNLSGRCGMSCCATGCTPCCDPCGYNSCGMGGCGAGCGGWAFSALAGFRYLRLEDNLEFASDPNDTAFTGELDELYYTMDCENDLFGVQFGGMGERAIAGSRLSATFGAKAGVFFNDADARSRIGGAAGTAVINNGPNNGVLWDISSHKDDVATIAEVQAGLAYRVTPTWRVRGDYRVIGISGVALPTNQIYQDLRGVQDVALLSTNGDLILHGVFVGAERTY